MTSWMVSCAGHGIAHRTTKLWTVSLRRLCGITYEATRGGGRKGVRPAHQVSQLSLLSPASCSLCTRSPHMPVSILVSCCAFSHQALTGRWLIHPGLTHGRPPSSGALWSASAAAWFHPSWSMPRLTCIRPKRLRSITDPFSVAAQLTSCLKQHMWAAKPAGFMLVKPHPGRSPPIV